MRILGKCPNCKEKDTILVSEQPSEEKKGAVCSNCNQKWGEWISFIGKQEAKGNKLIPVKVYNWGPSVEVFWPMESEIPFTRLIISVLNTALITHFKLEVCLATEGGVQGRVKGEFIELRNCDGKIGLYDEYFSQNKTVCQEVLKWYAELLETLLEEELIIDGQSFGRGAILRLSEKSLDDEANAKLFLWLALHKKTGSRGFATEVFKRMEIELKSLFSGPYLTGLTPEQIVKFFVPPPGFNL